MKLDRYDWGKDQNIPFKANEKEVAKLVNFFLNSKAWHEDLELVHKKVREFRRKAEFVKPEEPRQGAQAGA